MKSIPKVGILLSTYNGEDFLCEQIDSILKQEGDFEFDLWIRDDGSTDHTIKLIKKYALNNNVHWYSDINLNAAYSFLDLLRRCFDYDYYSFADQDDYWMPNKIKCAIDELQTINQSKPAIYFSNAELVDERLGYLGRNVYKKKPKTDFQTLVCAGGILGCTMVFNAAMAKLVQKKDMPKEIVMHDFYLAILCVAFKGKVVFDKTPRIKYRQHEKNVIGVPYNRKMTIKKRIQDIKQKSNISIANQANSILNIYGNELDETQRKWLHKVSHYKTSFITRISLACTTKTRYINLNMSLKLRLSILLGNR